MTVERALEPELMDRPDADRDELSRSLEDLRLVNRWLGALPAAARLVLNMAARVPSEPVKLLDVGTGAADIPLEIVRRGRRSGITFRVTATDLHPVTLEFAREALKAAPEIRLASANALALPFPDGAFDIAMCHTMLHHLRRAEAEVALRELDRVARWGVVVTDLTRSPLALCGARTLAITLWRRHRITRHDGPASIRSAFTPLELRTLAADALRDRFRVRKRLLFRMSLVVDRTAQIGSGGGRRRAR